MSRPHPSPPRTASDDIEAATLRSSRRAFRRFMVVALALNAVVAAGTVAYDVIDVFGVTRDFLIADAESAAATARRLRAERPGAPITDVVSRAAALTGRAMALVDGRGEVRFATHPAIRRWAREIYDEGAPRPGIRIRVGEELGPLSGGWKVVPFEGDLSLLVIAPRTPADEGQVRYVTVGAGVIGLGLLATFAVFLVGANLLVHRPLSRELAGLTRALAEDVSERRRAEAEAVKARVEAEKTLAFRDSLIDASTWMGIVATGDDGRVAIYNRAAEAMLGRPAGEVVGQATLTEVLAPAQAGAPDLPAVTPGGPLERTVRGAGGELRRIALTVSDIRDPDGARRGRLAVFADVTERRRLEQELRLNELQLIQSAKMASLGEMATGIAHELNQPLNHIGILASRLRRRLGELPPETASFYEEKLDRLAGQVRRASRIIDQLRVFGHPDAGDVGAVDVAARVRSVLDLVGRQLRMAGVDLAVSLPPDLPRARANAAHLEQILVNLLVNARDALAERPPDAPARRIAVRARAAVGPDGEEAVEVSVADNGPGVPAAIAGRIFEPFFTTKEVGKGTGLGLAISYSLVRGFGGAIEVESAEGQGTTFTVRMAAATGDARQGAA